MNIKQTVEKVYFWWHKRLKKIFIWFLQTTSGNFAYIFMQLSYATKHGFKKIQQVLGRLINPIQYLALNQSSKVSNIEPVPCVTLTLCIFLFKFFSAKFYIFEPFFCIFGAQTCWAANICLTLSLTAQVIYNLALWRITQKNFKFNKSQNFSIPGAVSYESILLKVFLNSLTLFLLRAEIVK